MENLYKKYYPKTIALTAITLSDTIYKTNTNVDLIKKGEKKEDTMQCFK